MQHGLQFFFKQCSFLHAVRVRELEHVSETTQVPPEVMHVEFYIKAGREKYGLLSSGQSAARAPGGKGV